MRAPASVRLQVCARMLVRMRAHVCSPVKSTASLARMKTRGSNTDTRYHNCPLRFVREQSGSSSGSNSGSASASASGGGGGGGGGGSLSGGGSTAGGSASSASRGSAYEESAGGDSASKRQSKHRQRSTTQPAEPQVTKVLVRCGELVDQISFEFKDGKTKTWGTLSGMEAAPFEIPEGECIVHIRLSQGDSLDGVQFVTNR